MRGDEPVSKQLHRADRTSSSDVAFGKDIQKHQPHVVSKELKVKMHKAIKNRSHLIPVRITRKDGVITTVFKRPEDMRKELIVRETEGEYSTKAVVNGGILHKGKLPVFTVEKLESVAKKDNPMELDLEQFKTIGDYIDYYKENFVNAEIRDTLGKRIIFRDDLFKHITGLDRVLKEKHKKGALSQEAKKGPLLVNRLTFSGTEPHGVQAENLFSIYENNVTDKRSQEYFDRSPKINWILDSIKSPDFILKDNKLEKGRVYQETYVKRYENDRLILVGVTKENVPEGQSSSEADQLALTSFDICTAEDKEKFIESIRDEKKYNLIWEKDQSSLQKALSFLKAAVSGTPRFMTFKRLRRHIDNNTDTDPTDAQIKAGNYKKASFPWQGLNVTIENPAGSYRSGTDREGHEWKTKIHFDYGYIKGTEGNDGDHVDVFIGPGISHDKESDKNSMVFVINQVDPRTGKFDEHKCMIGFTSEDEAR